MLLRKTVLFHPSLIKRGMECPSKKGLIIEAVNPKESVDWRQRVIEDPESRQWYQIFCETFSEFRVEFSDDGKNLLVFGREDRVIYSFLAETVLS